MKLHKILFPALILILALVLMACGGAETAANESAAGDDTSGGETTSGADTSGEEAEAETVSAGDPVAGEELYNQVCIACHGEGGQGIEGLGKPFTTSEFVQTHSDEELLDFIKTGRPISDPENTTGVDMPPKGGNPALTDEQILDIIAYLRTLSE